MSSADAAETHLDEMDKVAQSPIKELNTTLVKRKRKSKPAEPFRWIQRDEDGNIVGQTSNLSSADDAETRLEEMVKVAKSLTEDLNTTLVKKKRKSKPAEPCRWTQRDKDGNIVAQTSKSPSSNSCNMSSANVAKTHLEEMVEVAKSLTEDLNTTLVKKKRKSKPAEPSRWRERDEDGNIVPQTSKSPSSNPCDLVQKDKQQRDPQTRAVPLGAKRLRSSTRSVPEGNQLQLSPKLKTVM